MPIIVCLKEPGINLVCKGEIKDDEKTAAEYDALFPNPMVQDQDGQNMVIPLSVDCNIAFIKEVTQAELDKRKAEAEKRKKLAEAQGGGGGSPLIKPEMLFPSNRGGRG